MTAKVISFGIQKGGVGKSTTCGVVAAMLAKDDNRVLVVDMDSQGNVTDLVTQLDPEEFQDRTILEAFQENNAKKYILTTDNENVDVLPADDYLATLAKFLFLEYKGNRAKALDELLKPLKETYDYILIDTPPSLSEPMINAVVASDYVVILAESSKWAFTAIPRFIETIMYARDNLNPKLKIAGVLRTMNDARRSDSKAFVSLIAEEYPRLVFKTVIKRKASTGRLSIEGLFENKEMNSATKEYRKFYKELMEVII